MYISLETNLISVVEKIEAQAYKAMCPAHGSYSVMANTFPTGHSCRAIFSHILSYSFPSAFFEYGCSTDCKSPQPYCHLSCTYVFI